MAYEGVLRVGLVCAGSGVPPSQIITEPVSTLDLAPIFTDYGYACNLGVTHGRSLRTLLEGKVDIRDYDLYNDPYEMENLFDPANPSGIQKELTAMTYSRPDDVLSVPLEPSRTA